MAEASSRVRARVRRMAESWWQRPASAVYLGSVRPEYRVSGRRADGTVEGTGLVRRSVRTVVRGAIGGVVNVILSVAGGGAANVLARRGSVTGPADAAALELVDPARRAHTVWLVFSDTRIAAVDSGYSFREPADDEPRVLWQADKPDAPVLSVRRRSLTWPDGSVFTFDLDYEQVRLLREDPIAHRHTRWGEPPPTPDARRR